MFGVSRIPGTKKRISIESYGFPISSLVGIEFSFRVPGLDFATLGLGFWVEGLGVLELIWVFSSLWALT